MFQNALTYNKVLFGVNTFWNIKLLFENIFHKNKFFTKINFKIYLTSLKISQNELHASNFKPFISQPFLGVLNEMLD